MAQTVYTVEAGRRSFRVADPEAAEEWSERGAVVKAEASAGS